MTAKEELVRLKQALINLSYSERRKELACIGDNYRWLKVSGYVDAVNDLLDIYVEPRIRSIELEEREEMVSKASKIGQEFF